jgi:hypothetical protein
MATKMLPPKITVWWVPATPGIEDIDAPTAAEINAGVDISCAITVDNFTLGWTDRDLDDSRSLCDVDNVENPTAKNVEADLTFFLDDDFDDNTSVFNEAMDLFETPLQRGFLVQRIGKNPNTDPLAEAGDRVTVFDVLSGDPNIENDGDAPVRMQVRFYPQGQSSNGIVTVTAGS